MPDRRGNDEGLSARAMRRGLGLVVRHGLRGVWLRGELPPGPFVWATNHHSWWDPFVAMVLLQRFGRASCVLMLQQNLDRYAFARPLGVFGTGEHRRGLGYLRAGRVLVIFPEGGLMPAGPPAELATGAAWYATRAGVPLCAAAARVLARGQQVPEAYVSVAEVAGGGEGTEWLTTRLAVELVRRLDEVERLNATADPRKPLPGFTRVVTGRRSWDERVDRIARRLPWPH